ncbi:putative Eukaryotic translation initiation factor 1A, X-chromosomal [Blattamonas nauphoetae]|uniref:Eukaryotic translation initiation factor 1A, X-chromosomal n=1 Tax=Blattamonas nauphoetae TaxID=2049346 RepID=A0ABQ9Y2P3_9EUKA|nr:putative Eukaryotic translation initiation factor 1A, X-chromosomal [Blattamonas nauphoetae]
MSRSKGSKNRKGPRRDQDEKRELIFKEECQEYAQVIRMLGNGRLEANCFDGKKRQCTIRGKMIRRVWIKPGDVVLISLRDFQDDKADVILKYSPDEAKRLKEFGHIPEHIQISEAQTEGGAGNDDIRFVSDDEEGVDVDTL